MGRMRKRVAVVGAGAAGLAAGKYLLDAGFDVTIFEAGSNVGGLWVYENDNGRSQAYRHLCIISTRKYTRFSDHPFDDDTPQFPTHWDMHRYMDQYATKFGLKDHIQFRSEVSRVEPEGEPGDDLEWRVTLASGHSEAYDAVLVATGHLNEPNHDPMLQSFTGTYLHSRDYRVADPYVRKNVCVVGAGNSGVDIASDVCGVAERTVLVARSGVLINPKVVFGVPLPEITVALRKKWIPTFVRNAILRTLVYAAHGNLERLGLSKPTRKQHPTSSEAIVSHIEFNRVAVKPGIVSVDGQKVTFADGTTEEFDVLVGATGYRVHLPFIPPEVVPIDGNHVDLYKRIFPPDWPGLCFVGMLNPQSTLNRIFEEQSKLLVEYLSGNVTLPSPGEMRSDINHRNARTRSTFQQTARHEMEEPDMGYVDELRQLYSSPSALAGAGLGSRMSHITRRMTARVGAQPPR